MKVPLSWLKKYVDLQIGPEAIAEAMTLGGLEVEEVLKVADDVVFEISLTPNLGHCFSILGVARDLSALLNVPLKKVEAVNLREDPAVECVAVELLDKKQCLRYSCRLVRDVQVGPSPDWLKHRLEQCGLRSVNNVVDVGNLIMLERGQPLHMFDAEKMEGNRLIITSHTDYETLETLDGVVRDIPQEALLICDAKKPLAFAGVMGGMHSGVTEKTRQVLIESALFTPQAIRKTCKLLGLRSDSSQRFERGVDPNGVLDALDEAAVLLEGRAVSKALNLQAHAFEGKKISCRLRRVNQILGTELSLREVIALFLRLEINILQERQDSLLVCPPSYRNDLVTEIDLIEEVARVYGYNFLPKRTPLHISSPLSDAPIYRFERDARSALLGEGLQEFITCDLISPQQAEMTVEHGLSSNAFISVLQPRSIEQSVLRTTLLPGLLQVVKHNGNHQNGEISGFEVGRVHFRREAQYTEQTVAAIVLTGSATPYHWDPKPRVVDFYDLKGIVENFLSSFKVENFQIEPSHLHNFHPGRQARIKVGDLFLGAFGEVHPAHLSHLDIGGRVLFAEINLHDLFAFVPKHWKVVSLPLYPRSERDWTLTVREEVPVSQLLNALSSSVSSLVERVLFLDLYKSEQIGKNRKNVTFRFIYRDANKTLSFEEVEKEHARLIQDAAEKLKSCLL